MKQNNSIWDFWDRIYCINLPERTDRWGDTLVEFNNVGISEFEKINGLRYLNNGNAGCYMSHLSILKDAIDKGYERIMIFEDDVKFLSDGVDNLDRSQSQLSKLNWDAYFLGFRTSAPILQAGDSLGIIVNATMTHAIGYNKKSMSRAVELLEKTKPIEGLVCPIDQSGIFSDLLSFNVFCSYPLCAIQRRSKSDIQDAEVTDHENDCINEYYNNFKYNWKKVCKIRIGNKVSFLLIGEECATDCDTGETHLVSFINENSISFNGTTLNKDGGYYRGQNIVMDLFYA